MGKTSLGWVVAAWTLLASPAFADSALTAKMDAAVREIDSGAFSGAVLVTEDGNIVFDQAYGFADTAHKNPNRATTSFHVGTLSAQYTATAVMMLVDKQRLWLTNTVGQFLPGAAGGDRITIADLLARDPQTDPAAWRTLARIVEIVSARSFAEALDTDFFGPLFMTGSGLDDGTLAPARRMAQGDAAAPAGWAGLEGSASAYTTTRDELRWIDALFGGSLVSDTARAALLAGSWNRADAARFGGPAYFGAGRAPGFAAFVLHVPARDVTVIVLGNSGAGDVAADLGNALAALAMDKSAP